MAHNTRRYIDVLDDLLKSSNHTFHSGIKMTLVEVIRENTLQVFCNLYGPASSRNEAKPLKFRREIW